LTHYRISGTQGREECAVYFISKFQEIDSNFTYILHNFTVNSVECQNVLFKFNENYSNILILGAHYDSRARATKDSTSLDSPVPGANDGASGSAVLIELARAIYNRSVDLHVQIWFLFFDAEDQGYDQNYGITGWDWCEGSTKFVEEIESFYNSSTEHFDAMILLDMVGGTGLRFINEQHSTSSLLNELFEIGRQLGYTSEFPVIAISQSITDDHVPFVNYGIPSADLIINFWNNPKWPYHHTIEDNLLHISNFSLEATGRTVEQFIYNNYLDSEEEYQGKYPWKGDLNLPDTQTLNIILTITAVVGISIVVYSIIKKLNYNDKSNLQ
jgi:Zn-dependent M28 family amino/carboxypeptidase